MALIKCKECEHEVSSKAETCPKCGARVSAKHYGCGTLIGVIFLGVIIITAFSSIFSSIKKPDTSSPSTVSSSESISRPAAKTEPPSPGSQWYYNHSDDQMGKGSTHQAIVLSSNTVNFDFPYSGEQRASLTLRTHPRYGKDLVFRIEKGQILCQSYKDCTVLVRFDDEEPTNYSARGAADNSNETIFIRNYSQFVGKMLKAKRVRIAANIYQEGTPVFDFDVSGFDVEKYLPKK